MIGYPYCEAVYRGQNILHSKLKSFILQNTRIILDKTRPLDFLECLRVLKDNYTVINFSKEVHLGIQWLHGVRNRVAHPMEDFSDRDTNTAFDFLIRLGDFLSATIEVEELKKLYLTLHNCNTPIIKPLPVAPNIGISRIPTDKEKFIKGWRVPPKDWARNYTGKYDDDYAEDVRLNARYVLRTSGEKPLICIGVNPNTATDEVSDPTIREVLEYGDIENFSGIIMLNLYPLRCSKPDCLPLEADEILIEQNAEKIKVVLRKIALKYRQITIWAGWGDSFEKREYFGKCLSSIVKVANDKDFDCVWKTAGLTGKNNPRHPLPFARMRNEGKARPEFIVFNPQWYMRLKRIVQ